METSKRGSGSLNMKINKARFEDVYFTKERSDLQWVYQEGPDKKKGIGDFQKGVI